MTEKRSRHQMMGVVKHSSATYRREAVIRGRSRVTHTLGSRDTQREALMKLLKDLSSSELGEIADYIDELRWDIEFRHSDAAFAELEAKAMQAFRDGKTRPLNLDNREISGT